MSKVNIERLHPPATIGLVGGGQLGRMFIFEAKRMGYNVVVLDPNHNSPAGQVADQQIVADFSDRDAYLQLAKESDVITYEFEHIDAEILKHVENQGFRVIPSSKTLEIIQDKYRQKTFLEEIGVKVARFSSVQDFDDLKSKFELMNRKGILKSCTNGYDGKGNFLVRSEDDLEKAFLEFGEQGILIEELVDFVREVSIVVVRNQSGVFFYPVSENVHSKSILIKTLVPAAIPEGLEAKIIEISEKIAHELDDFGVYCIEYFIDKNQEVLVNEIAPRPHNSGHYTIEGCVSSQFEQLVRVVCGMPAGSTQLRKPCAMYNILGDQHVSGEYEIGGLEGVLEIEDCHLHLYGKQKTGNLRKIGHLTAFGQTREDADLKAIKARSMLSIREKK